MQGFCRENVPGALGKTTESRLDETVRIFHSVLFDVFRRGVHACVILRLREI